MYQLLFPFSLFLSASLLFIIQPMVAKALLPVYGGTPAVWTICMLFFQASLFVAYGYAWILSQCKGRFSWQIIHLLVCCLSLCVLPWVFSPGVMNHESPEHQILKTLLLQLGLPLLVVGTASPLLQYVYSQTGEKQAKDPYFLYVASNVGSLLALLGYPLCIERFSGIHQQFIGWSTLYVVYIVLMGLLLWKGRSDTHIVPMVVKSTESRLTEKMAWVILSFIPCSLMLGLTFYISTDIAATPFIWVLPLAVYLLSFMITFASKPWIAHQWVVRHVLFFFALPVVGFIMGPHRVPVLPLMLANVLGFGVMALLCHGELVRRRPAAAQLTSFYCYLSLGGVLAGVFNGIVAPRLFSHAYEYPLVMLLILLCLPMAWKTHGSWRRQTGFEGWLPLLVFMLLVVFRFSGASSEFYLWIEIGVLGLIMVSIPSRRSLGLSMAILFAFIAMPNVQSGKILNQQRNFYGIKQVFSKEGAHVLMSQSTLHGFQVPGDVNPVDGSRAYYGAIVSVIQHLQNLYQPLRTMVLGLGTGIMACQFRANDELTMVEIDEQVINIASNPKLFTYLQECPVPTTLIKDDGLMAAKRRPDNSFELLVMDAFNSDAVPVHLLTLEALTLYKKKITTDGVILVNISNRHLRLLPVLTGAGRALDMVVLHKSQAANHRAGQLAAEWVLLTTNELLASRLLGREGWHFVTDAQATVWTNDHSNFITLLQWA